MTLGYGIRHSFSVFFPSILDEFGWSRGGKALLLAGADAGLAMSDSVPEEKRRWTTPLIVASREGHADVAALLSHVHVPVPDTPECAIDGSEVSHLELFRTLRSIGYDRRISIEDHGSRFTDFPAQAAPVLRRLKSLWEEAA